MKVLHHGRTCLELSEFRDFEDVVKRYTQYVNSHLSFAVPAKFCAVCVSVCMFVEWLLFYCERNGANFRPCALLQCSNSVLKNAAAFGRDCEKQVCLLPNASMRVKCRRKWSIDTKRL